MLAASHAVKGIRDAVLPSTKGSCMPWIGGEGRRCTALLDSEMHKNGEVGE